ncbi:hypothetical protein J3E07_001607 [Methanococcus voltae]|uniref:Uncharacterized protein n=1 Tax=Methanococcus voltae TaxID=2188 RepID=A0A8J7RJR2_METVO|nr:hypothetical protein [Methanococcus voltae]MBP2202166.1 hypothetical protein [Methanococcus voltae]
MIQQLLCIILSFLLTIAYYTEVETLGSYFLLPDGLIAWCIPSFIILLCTWKLAERKSDIWTGISLFVGYMFITVYYSGGFSSIIIDLAKAAGLGVIGVVIGSKIKID